MNSVHDKSKAYDRLYDQLKSDAMPLVEELFRSNDGFTDDPSDEILKLKKTFGKKPLRFLQVLQKYYMMATMGQNEYPVAHTSQFMLMAWLLWFRRRKTLSVIDSYKNLYLEKIARFEKMLPQIDFSDNHKHMIKVMMANTLAVFINQPVFKKKNHHEEMHKAFLKGFYVGITYVVADLSLDAGILPDDLKPAFHQRTLDALSGKPVAPHENNLLHFIHVIQQESAKDLPFSENEYIYKILYLLEKAQYEERHLDVDLNKQESIIEKTMLLGLKTHFTLMSIRFNSEKEFQQGMNDGVLWSLYCQLTDDIRDFHQDKREGLTTLFTGFEQGQTAFNPYSFYLHLTHHFSKHYHAKWLYKDFIEYLRRNENPELKALDDEKAAIFIKRLTGIDLEAFEKAH